MIVPVVRAALLIVRVPDANENAAFVEFTKDEDYRDNKVKMGSLYKLFIQKKSAEAIDSDLNFIHEDDLNPAVFYNPNNSFT